MSEESELWHYFEREFTSWSGLWVVCEWYVRCVYVWFVSGLWVVWEWLNQYQEYITKYGVSQDMYV